MSEDRSYGKLILVDTNLFFVKRLTEELQKQGLEVIHCTEPAYALTAVEWNMPVAILCATNLTNSDVYTIPGILHADERTRHIAVVAIGDGGEQPLLDAFRAGYDDFVERRIGAREVAGRLVSFLLSRRNAFKLPPMDLSGVIQSLARSGQTGALRMNAPASEGIVFFQTGQIIHAESGSFVGDAAILDMIENCSGVDDSVYKFVRGCATPAVRTVQCSVEELIPDSMREEEVSHE